MLYVKYISIEKRDVKCSALWNVELSISGKFQEEAHDFLSLHIKLYWEALVSQAPALILSNSRWEGAIWRLNGPTSLLLLPQGSVSICHQTTMVMNPASFSE